jgi:3'-phosphoadenosine 5'-phosphosulfate sulfotransferase (PAPS reductase)/FAD synthetase
MTELPICSVSGGKDSTALYLLMMEYFGNNFLPIFSDTGHEHPVTVNYVRNLHLMTGGPEVVVVHADFRKPIATRRASKTPSGIR